MLTNREIITAKIETTYGTLNAPAGTDAVLCQNVSFKFVNTKMEERKAVRASLSALQAIYGGRLGELSFDVECKGSGAAGSAPEIGQLLRACSMSQTVDSGVSVIYKPLSDPASQESITLYYYQDGLLTAMNGCVGDWTLKLETSKPAFFSFKFTGHVANPSQTALTTPTYDSTVPVPLLNSAFTIGAYAADYTNLTLSIGNAVAIPVSAQGTDGYGLLRVSKRDVAGSFDPEMVALATNSNPYISSWVAGTKMALTTGAIGATAGNIFTIACPQVYYKSVSDTDRNGIRAHEIQFGCVENSGDDEVSITFT